MGIKQLYNDNLRKLPNKYGDVSVMSWRFKKMPKKWYILDKVFWLKELSEDESRITCRVTTFPKIFFRAAAKIGLKF